MIERPCCWRPPVNQKLTSPKVLFAQSAIASSPAAFDSRKFGQARPPIEGSGVRQTAKLCELRRKSRVRWSRVAVSHTSMALVSQPCRTRPSVSGSTRSRRSRIAPCCQSIGYADAAPCRGITSKGPRGEPSAFLPLMSR